MHLLGKSAFPRKPLCLTAFLAVLLQAGPAAAQFAALPFLSEDDAVFLRGPTEPAGGLYAVSLSGELQTLSQSLAIHALLVALEEDHDASIERLIGERQRFIEIIGMLRSDSEAIGISEASMPKIMEKLDRLEREWAIFGPALASIIETRKATRDNVAIVAESIEPLAQATSDLIEISEYYATGGEIFSVLTGTVRALEEQRALLNKITAEYFLVAHGHQEAIHRSKLRAHRLQFEETLKGTIEGDRRLGLLRPPTPELMDRLLDIQGIWARLSPAIEEVANGKPVDRRLIPEITQQSNRAVQQIGKVVTLYESL